MEGALGDGIGHVAVEHHVGEVGGCDHDTLVAGQAVPAAQAEEPLDLLVDGTDGLDRAAGAMPSSGRRRRMTS